MAKGKKREKKRGGCKSNKTKKRKVTKKNQMPPDPHRSPAAKGAPRKRSDETE